MFLTFFTITTKELQKYLKTLKSQKFRVKKSKKPKTKLVLKKSKKPKTFVLKNPKKSC